ncbi:MAG: NADH-quinone oxidoreductase subunit A [Acidobacteria bacterium]|nr:MAG: NADH-quinone oxidoreductase subunit A [Acidobacteriota bacterium]MCE7956674.1 NADH-quinone oxidoreductase subunit A [Acidobacteria bacterium ACB2]
MGTPAAFLPVLLMIVAAVGIGVALLLLNNLLGRKVRTRRKLSPYESGMPLLDESRKRISVKFFIVAMMFIVFDVEAAFLYPWAVVFRGAGWALFAEMALFLCVLFLGYAYLWKKGAFDWE